jgi:hypothetical protein
MNYFDSARQSQIEGFRSERGGLSPRGKDDEEDRFGKVAASQNGLGSCLTVPNVHRYKLPLKTGAFREGILIQNEGLWGEIAPLAGWSRETLEEAEREATNLLPHFPSVQPSLPSVKFAFACAQTPLPNTLRVKVAALETPRPGFCCLKIKVGTLTPKEAIAKVKALPKGLSLRVDFNRNWCHSARL